MRIHDELRVTNGAISLGMLYTSVCVRTDAHKFAPIYPHPMSLRTKILKIFDASLWPLKIFA